jgi:hypothetical protein
VVVVPALPPMVAHLLAVLDLLAPLQDPVLREEEVAAVLTAQELWEEQEGEGLEVVTVLAVLEQLIQAAVVAAGPAALAAALAAPAS